MKRIPAVLFWVAVIAFLAPRVPDGFGMPDESPGVFGPVRSIRTETALFTMKDGKWVEGARVLTSVVQVDPVRRQIMSTHMLKDGAAGSRTVFELDSAGRTVRKTITSRDGKVFLVMTCEYDRDGRLAAKTVSHPLENRSTHLVNTHNSGGAVKLTQFFQNNETKAITRTYAYDRDGREIERVTHDPNGVVTTRVVARYDRKGNRTETWHEESSDEKAYTYTFDYDASGNLTLQSLVPGEEERFSYEFDSYGNPVKTTSTLCQLRFGILRQCSPQSVAYNAITYYPTVQ